jgi:hypothetical protein
LGELYCLGAVLGELFRLDRLSESCDVADKKRTPGVMGWAHSCRSGCTACLVIPWSNGAVATVAVLVAGGLRPPPSVPAGARHCIGGSCRGNALNTLQVAARGTSTPPGGGVLSQGKGERVGVLRYWVGGGGDSDQLGAWVQCTVSCLGL